MNGEQTDGGAAFPATEGEGISLRDYFAGQALANSSLVFGGLSHRYLADLVYQIADAMLIERAGGDE